jgi:geranylgeranyl pyrophosphate synthase
MQVAILAGDFLLARASVSLAALRNPEAILLMSQSLEHLVAGEILQVGLGLNPKGEDGSFASFSHIFCTSCLRPLPSSCHRAPPIT